MLKKPVNSSAKSLLESMSKFTSTSFVLKKANSTSESVPRSGMGVIMRKSFYETTYQVADTDKSNIAEQLIEKGLASVVRHKRDDEDRSSDYDKLMAAEQAQVLLQSFLSSESL